MDLRSLLIALAVTAAFVGAYFWLAPKPEPIATTDPRQPDLISVQEAFAPSAVKIPFKTLKTGLVELLQPGLRLPAHYRERSHEFLLLVNGEGLGFIGDRTVKAKAGQLMVVPAGTATMLAKRGDQELQFISFVTPLSTEHDYKLLLIGDDYPFGDPSAVSPKTPAPTGVREEIQMGVVDLAQRFAQGLDQESDGFRLAILARGRSGSVALLQIDGAVKSHQHPKENHILYVWQGRAQGTIADQSVEWAPGQLIFIPAGIWHELTRLGDEPVQLVLFSTPAFNPKDIIWEER